MNVVCEWGLQGMRATARKRVVVIVDVLSFSTAATIAVGRGATILPCEWNDERAEVLAKKERAELASKRGQGRFSLAPASMRDVPRGLRLVLPSPNGSTLASFARELSATAVVIGCLRNAAAVARWVSQRPVAVIAAGERWQDQSLRFAIEDWLGAGAIISHLPGQRSYEAESAAVAFEKMRDNIRDVVATSRSGRELIDLGYPDDVDLASEVDVDEAVPVLDGIAFTLPRS
jgi:2-phosphosulfolactate phosphatase